MFLHISSLCSFADLVSLENPRESHSLQRSVKRAIASSEPFSFIASLKHKQTVNPPLINKARISKLAGSTGISQGKKDEYNLGGLGDFLTRKANRKQLRVHLSPLKNMDEETECYIAIIAYHDIDFK